MVIRQQLTLLMRIPKLQPFTLSPVSYTHLDVYKRQNLTRLKKTMSGLEMKQRIVAVRGMGYRLETGVAP